MTPALIIAGPTAVGKSSFAIAVAQAVGAEIVSADSRQVYLGLDIGTAKPMPEEQEAVPHHGIDILNQGDPYSAGQFLQDARAAIAEIQARGRPVVVVGGSTLYVHAMIEGLADLPPLDPDLFRTLSDLAGTEAGRLDLFEELRSADPVAAQTLDPTKSQRLARLVGVLRQSGRRPSEAWSESLIPGVPHHLVLLSCPRDALYRRIDLRVVSMMEAGLLDEVKRLMRGGPGVRALLDTTIGYRELASHLDGEIRLEEAVALIQRNSRRYAKRQLTWYRRYAHALRLDARTASATDVLDALPWPSIT